jgi:hypothetical protein
LIGAVHKKYACICERDEIDEETYNLFQKLSDNGKYCRDKTLRKYFCSQQSYFTGSFELIIFHKITSDQWNRFIGFLLQNDATELQPEPDERIYYDLETCKRKVQEYVAEDPELKKDSLDLDKMYDRLCQIDLSFPPAGMWTAYYHVSNLREIIPVTKKRKPRIVTPSDTSMSTPPSSLDIVFQDL